MGALSRIAAALLAAAALAGCGGPGEETTSERATAPPPERIVVVSPSLAEIVFRLGEGGRIVGVGDFVRYPAEAAELPRIGGLFDPRLERIVALQPDLAILLPSEQELATRLQGLGIQILTVPAETLDDVEAALATIGRRLGASARAEALVAEWRERLAPDPLSGAPRVVLSLAREGGRLSQVLCAGPGTFFDELLDRLGAVNLMADAPVRYPQVGPEEIVERRPEVIVELQPEPPSEEQGARMVQEWERLLGRGRVCVRLISGDHTLLPGPRLPRLYAELGEAIGSCAALEPETVGS
ncbi:MAG: helical backbone metal receptor [Thermoanaerobaculia bacterium]|nr:helical backbone metal receptor [Thermoanaerobaculia bacterium]